MNVKCCLLQKLPMHVKYVTKPPFYKNLFFTYCQLSYAYVKLVDVIYVS